MPLNRVLALVGDRRQIVPALGTAAVTSFLSIVACVSYPAIVFSGELEPFLPFGIGIAFLSAALLGGIVSLTSSYPGSIGYSQSEPAVIVGLIAASMAALLQAEGRPDLILPTVLAVIAVGAVGCGLFFVFLGTFRLGNLIRFIPFPVMGGFLAGIGWLLALAALSSMAGKRIGPGNAADFLTMGLAAKWLPGVAAGMLLWALQTWRRSAANLPGVLGGAIALFWLVVALGEAPVAEWRAQGWLLGPFPESGLWSPAQLPRLLSDAAWHLFPEHIAEFATLLILTAIALLLTANGIELATRRDLDLNRELRFIGLGNVVAGLAGGHPGYHALSASVLAHRMGTPVRLVGVVTAVVCAGALFVGAKVLGSVPKLVTGALLTYLAIGFLADWLYATWRRMPLADYAVLLLVFATVVSAGFMEAIGLGTAAGVALFVIRYSKIGVARNILSGSAYHSNVDRAEAQRVVLLTRGDQIFILKLQGFMFFGTASTLVSMVRQRLDDHGRVFLRYLVCDFRLVHGIDASAAASFTKLVQYAEEKDFSLVLAAMPPEVSALLRRERIDEGVAPRVRVFPDLDHGLEWAENDLLSREGARPSAASDAFEAQLRIMLPGPAEAERFRAYLEPITYESGERLIHQAAQSDDILFIASGQVAIVLELPNGQTLRLKSMGAGTVVGEIAFYLGVPRSASVVALEKTTAWRLSSTRLRDMQREAPTLATLFHQYMARMLATKVVDTNRLVGALNQ
jgi:sulfate permease, SulP family